MAATVAAPVRLKAEIMRRIMAFPPKSCDGQAVGIGPGNTDFFFAQITGRILGPWVAGQLQGADTGVAAANVLLGTGPATPLEGPGTLSQGGEHPVITLPKLRERHILDAADGVIGPVGIGMHIALRVDIGHANTG